MLVFGGVGVLLWTKAGRWKYCQMKKWTVKDLLEVIWVDSLEGQHEKALFDIWFIRHRSTGCTDSHDQGRWAFFRSTNSKSAKFCVIILFWTSPGHVTYGFSRCSFLPMTCSNVPVFGSGKISVFYHPKDLLMVLVSSKPWRMNRKCLVAFTALTCRAHFLRLVVVTKGFRCGVVASREIGVSSCILWVSSTFQLLVC